MGHAQVQIFGEHHCKHEYFFRLRDGTKKYRNYAVCRECGERFHLPKLDKELMPYKKGG